jgi:hypothetical protein
MLSGCFLNNGGAVEVMVRLEKAETMPYRLFDRWRGRMMDVSQL